MPPRRYLIVAPAWIGDMVMAQSLFMRLKELWPDSTIDIVAPPWTLAVASRMHEVDDCIQAPFAHGRLDLSERRRLGKQLRERNYTHAIVIPSSLKAALLPFLARIPVRTGYRGEFRYGLLNDLRHLDKQQLPLCVQRFVALGESPTRSANPPTVQRPALRSDADAARALCHRLKLDAHTPVLAVCPGAEYGPAKRWPVEHFSEVARIAIAQGYLVWLFGSEKDTAVTQPICERLQTTGHQAVDLAGRTALAEAIDLLSMADRVISNDSGLMHIAAALNKPLAVVYGSSTADFTPPLSPHAHIISDALDCRPCFKRECPLGHLHCLTEIAPQRVWESFGQIPAQTVSI